MEEQKKDKKPFSNSCLNGAADMENPWKEIGLETYEKHMRLDSVRQLQALNSLMKDQLSAYPAESVMIFGAAGGNGFEHISTEQYRTVYAVDINSEYLRTVSERYAELLPILRCLHLDLVHEAEKLPQAELVIANLLIEYIGYAAFQKAVQQASPCYVSTVIQINRDAAEWVSDSPYLHEFDRLNAVHHQMDEQALTAAMQEIGYTAVFHDEKALPNGKALLRTDYLRSNG